MAFDPSHLMDHQRLAVEFIKTRPSSGLFLGMSFGKTLVTLAALQEVKPSGHILVIAPLTIARSVWVDEIREWGFSVRTKSLIVNERDKQLSRKKRLQRYAEIPDDPPTMYFINKELIPDLVKNMPVKNKKIQWPFRTVIIDESQGFANFTSERVKAMRKIRSATDHVIELTGTPTPSGPMNLFSQIWLLDQGQTFGNSITAFRDRYFRATMHVNDRPVKFEPIEGAEAEIYAKIKHLVMAAENTNIPLPEVTPRHQRKVNVTLPVDALETYRTMARDMVVEFTDDDPDDPEVVEVVADSAGVLHNKLLQLASGTVYTGEDHDTDYQVVHTEKLKMAEHLINGTGGSPVLLAYRYRSDKAQLMEHLSAAGHQVEAFDGSRQMIQRWNDSQIPVMLIQPASAGHGLNLQHGGHHIIWYTLPDSLEHYEQLNARLARIGQKHPVEIRELVTADTRDAGQAARAGLRASKGQARKLDEKRRSQDALLDAVRRSPADITAL